MSKYRLKVRYSRVEGGVVKKYKPGSEVELSDREVAKLGPAAFDWSPNVVTPDVPTPLVVNPGETAVGRVEPVASSAPDVPTSPAFETVTDPVVITPDVAAHVESFKKSTAKK